MFYPPANYYGHGGGGGYPTAYYHYPPPPYQENHAAANDDDDVLANVEANECVAANDDNVDLYETVYRDTIDRTFNSSYHRALYLVNNGDKDDDESIGSYI
jgi:hypothetical protein